MKIGCNTVAFREQPLDFALEKIAQAGYEYVEVEANLKWCGHLDPWHDDPVRFSDKIKSYGFKGVSAIGNHRELINSEQGTKDIEQALSWAGAAGVPLVATGEGRMPENMSQDTALGILKERLAHLVQVAEKHQVYLGMEDHGSISLTKEGLALITGLVSSDWLVVNFDTANIHRGDYVGTDSTKYEWKLGAKSSYSETELLRKVAPKVRHVHFKDVKGRNAVTLGTGEIDLVGCVKILQVVGFSGVLSYETEGWEKPDEACKMIRDSRAWMVDLLNKSH
jgi:sugar phosphate isomerase/epimerase